MTSRRDQATPVAAVQPAPADSPPSDTPSRSGTHTGRHGALGTGAPGPPRRGGRRWRVVALRWRVVALVMGLALVVLAAVWAVARHRKAPAAEGPPPATLQQAGEEVAVVLDSAALRRAGIQTAILGPAAGGSSGATAAGPRAASAAGATASLVLTGELVADPGRITTIRAAVPGRLTAPGGRWPALGERVAAGAIVAQVSDARPLAAPRGGVVTAVGAQPGEVVQAGQELLRLADFSELLARIAWRADAPPPPPSVRIVPLTVASAPAAGVAALGWPARLVGPAAEVDSLTRLPVHLYRLSGVPAGARPGLPVMAVVSERLVPRPAEGASAGAGAVPGTRTVLVPTAAVVQWEGLAWAFVQRAPGRFVRVRVDTSRPVRDGWLVGAAPAPTPDALAAGDAVVVQGAQQLLSAEFRSRLPQDEEEGGQ